MPNEKNQLIPSVGIALTTSCLMLFILATPLLTQVLPRFEDYAVALYRGAIHAPKWIRHVSADEWRDKEDVTENAALISGRWHQARQRHKEALLQIEGEERFEGLQQFFAAVHRLTLERRLSRIVYLVEKHAGSHGM